MKVTKDQKHVKWFLKCNEVWKTWLNKSYSGHPSNTNVCIYIRTSVVYPMVMGLSTLLAIGMAFTALVGYPASLYGLFDYLLTIGIFVGFFYVLRFVANSKFAEKWSEKQMERIEECVETKVSWWKMFWRWVVDKHDKICTLVEIADND